MKKILIFLITLIGSAMFVEEIRTPRSLNCFRCSNVKCIVREIDTRPGLLQHPVELLAEVRETSSWWD